MGPQGPAICTVLLDPRDPLLQSERTQGFAADPDYRKGEVFAYVGLPQNLKDLKAVCPLAGSAAILFAGGLDVIRKEAWPFYRTSSGVRLCWELKEPKGPKVPNPALQSTRRSSRASVAYYV